MIECKAGSKASTEDAVELLNIYNALGREGKTIVMNAAYLEKIRKENKQQ